MTKANLSAPLRRGLEPAVGVVPRSAPGFGVRFLGMSPIVAAASFQRDSVACEIPVSLASADADNACGPISRDTIRAFNVVVYSFTSSLASCPARLLVAGLQGYRGNTATILTEGARVDPSEPPADQRRFMRRATTPSGMVRIEMQLPPEMANVIWAAMNASLDAEAGAPKAKADSAEMPGEAGTRAANDASAEARPLDPTATPAERADAMVSVAQSFLDQPHRTLGSGYELVMMTSLAQLEHAPGGVSGFLRDGTPVPQHIARMLACDCARVDVQASESGEVLDVGRSRRTIPNAIARALWIRDGGCRVPGCGRKHHVHAHHLEAWADGGPTKLSNLALLCPYHHMLVHEGQLRVEVCEGELEFRNVHGLTLKPAPERGTEEIEAVTRWLNRIEPELDGDNYPKWDGSRLDLDAVLGWMFAAEARAAA